MSEITMTDTVMSNLKIIIAKAGSGFTTRSLQIEVCNEAADDDTREAMTTFFNYVIKDEAMTNAEEFLRLSEKELIKLFKESPVSHKWVKQLEILTQHIFKKGRGQSPAPDEPNIKRRKVTFGEKMRRNGTLQVVKPYFGRRELFAKALLRRDAEGILDKTGAEMMAEVFWKACRSHFKTRWVDKTFCNEAAAGMNEVGIRLPGRGKGMPPHQRQADLAQVLYRRIESSRRPDNYVTVSSRHNHTHTTTPCKFHTRAIRSQGRYQSVEFSKDDFDLAMLSDGVCSS